MCSDPGLVECAEKNLAGDCSRMTRRGFELKLALSPHESRRVLAASCLTHIIGLCGGKKQMRFASSAEFKLQVGSIVDDQSV